MRAIFLGASKDAQLLMCRLERTGEENGVRADVVHRLAHRT